MPWVVLVALALGAPARAHGEKTTSELEIAIDGSRIELHLLLTLHDLAAALFPDQGGDGRFDDQDAEAMIPRVLDFARRRFVVETAPAGDLRPAEGTVRYEGTIPAPPELFEKIHLDIRWAYDLDSPPRSVRFRLDYPQTGHEEHACHVRFRWEGREQVSTVLGGEFFEVSLPRAASGSGRTPRSSWLSALASPTLWGIVLALALSARGRVDLARICPAFAAGFVSGARVADIPPLAGSAGPLGVLAAGAILYLSAENLAIRDSSGRWAQARWPQAAIAGALGGAALGEGLSLGWLAATAGAATLGGAILAASVIALAAGRDTRKFEHAMRIGGNALAAALGATLVVLALV